jgi:hypothetical protein
MTYRGRIEHFSVAERVLRLRAEQDDVVGTEARVGGVGVHREARVLVAVGQLESEAARRQRLELRPTRDPHDVEPCTREPRRDQSSYRAHAEDHVPQGARSSHRVKDLA